MAATEDSSIYTGKTVEDAIESALSALNIYREDAVIEVIDEGKKGLILGIGAAPAKVRVTKKKETGGAERAAEFIDRILTILKISGISEVKEDGEKIVIDIQATNPGSVIGTDGEVIDAIQSIAGAVANIGNSEYRKVTVDCDNYREKREKELRALAVKLAAKAVEKGSKVTLRPMTPYERRIIHSALADRDDVKTVSKGSDPARCVVIIPSNLRERPQGRPGRKPQGGRTFNRDKRAAEAGGRPEARTGGRGPQGRRDGRGPQGGRDRDRREGGQGRPQGGYGLSRPASNARPARGKKEIHFGTYLGNSRDAEDTEKKDEGGEE